MFHNPEKHARAVGNVNEAVYAASGAAAEAQQDSPVTEAKKRLYGELDPLLHLIKRLEDRLSTVCAPEVETAQSGHDPLPPAVCQHVAELDHISREVRNAGIRLSMLLRRLAI